jgi:ATP-dependent Lhr-like helicase
VAFRWAQRQSLTFSIAANDYGVELLSSKLLDVEPDLLRTLLARDGLADDLLASLNISESARRQFRDIARIAGLVFKAIPGNASSTASCRRPAV